MSSKAASRRKRPGIVLFVECVLLALGILVVYRLLFWAHTQFYRAAFPVGYEQLVLGESAAQGLPPSLVFAVIRTESGFRPEVQSSVQARGLMQITNATFEWAQGRIGETEDLHFDDLFESELNIRYGTAILRLLLDEFQTEQNALCAYHAGWGNAKAWLANPDYAPDGEHIVHIPFGDTRRYVAKVLKTQETYETLYHFQ